MITQDLLLLALFVPILTACLVSVFGGYRQIREVIHIAGGAVLILCIGAIYQQFTLGADIELELWQIIPGISLKFTVEGYGLVYALVAAFLWPVAIIYSMGYMRGNREPNQTRFYVFYALSITCAIGIAFAGNLLTLFIFYEAMTLCTYPLVTHKASKEARRGGRVYIGILLGASILFLLPAVVITYNLAGNIDFAESRAMLENVSIEDWKLFGLLLLFLFGFAKAAIMPMHFWLPAAMVAPTPVSALLHAVAVVKAGVFTIIKMVVYIFGVDKLEGLRVFDGQWVEFFTSHVIVYLAGFTIIAAAVFALITDSLKRRLAFSTISQLSYIVLAVGLLNYAALNAAGVHIVAHAVSKITLFFVAGAIYVQARKTEISELDGIGRKMPVTMLCFTIAVLSMLSMPGTAIGVSKHMIGEGIAVSGSEFAHYIIWISLVLNTAYFLPIIYRAFFKTADDDTKDIAANIPMITAIAISAALIVAFPYYVEYILRILE